MHHKDEIENLENINDFLGLMLTFQSNGNTDIIETEAVKELKFMHDEYMDREANIIQSIRDEINSMYWDAKREDFIEEGEKKGYDSGLQQGNDSARLDDIKAIMKNLNCDIEHAMKLLNISDLDQRHYKELYQK